VTRLALALAILAGSALVPATAAAVVVPGPNGPLVFTSGRNDGTTTLSDGAAQIWFLSGPNGTAQRLTTLELSHHRHASWSPDRTKIAYARGPVDMNPFDGPWDIYVDDLTDAAPPFQITTTLTTNEDRPSWSPDGTRLAYAKQDPVDSNWDVVTKASDGTGAETPVADLASTGAQASGQFSRPQWSADGQEIFYGQIITVTPQNYDIHRAAADGSDFVLGGTAGTPVVAGTTNDYQPALAPDGENLCFTRQGATKDIAVAPSTGGAGTVLIAESGDEYECAWSPDDSNIAFVRGAFGAGEIRVKDLESNALSDSVTNVAGVFDGNPEWTYNPAPTCSNGSASVPFNGFVQIPLPCSDVPDPPTFGANSPFGPDIVTPPANGVLGGISNDSVIYTPNVNFQGTDSFTFKSDDGTSDSNIATIAITVGAPLGGSGNGGGGGGPTPTCAGQTATIVGTASGDVLLGTAGNDVIAGLGGNDRIRGARGSDVICSGSGADRVSGGGRGDRIAGGRGNDVLGGGSGNDRISGNGGADQLSGNSGRDSLSGGAGRDRLRGGSGRDRLRGDTGRDGLNGGASTDRCNGGPSIDTATRCEILSRIP
jgi:Tol biopolymer transport system component